MYNLSMATANTPTTHSALFSLANWVTTVHEGCYVDGIGCGKAAFVVGHYDRDANAILAAQKDFQAEGVKTRLEKDGKGNVVAVRLYLPKSGR